MTGMDWAMGADRNTRLTGMDRATETIYSGDAWVDCISYHQVSFDHTMNFTVHLLQLLISLVLAGIHRSKQYGVIWDMVASYPLTLFPRSSTQNCSFSPIPFGHCERCGRV
jgi:hypothetical protein